MEELTREEAEERLSCPHTEDCDADKEDIVYGTDTSRTRLEATVECLSCGGGDCWPYVAESEEGHIVESGDVLDSLRDISEFRYQSIGQTCEVSVVTEIDGELKVGLFWDLGKNYYSSGVVSLSLVEELFDKGSLRKLE